MMIDQFLDYLRYERRRSPRTVDRYGEVLKYYTDYLEERGDGLSWLSADADVIRDWMEVMIDKKIKPATVNMRLSALRSFYRFALREGAVDVNPAAKVNGPKKEKALPQFVKASEMDRLLDANCQEDDFKSLRARTLIIILYETGMRRAEIVGLNDADIDFGQGQLKVTGKRDKQRIIPFGEEVAESLHRYISARDNEVQRTSDALFVDNHGNRLTFEQLYKIVTRELSAVTTMKKRSPHVLRHSFATAMLNNGAGIESVRQLLGHESLATTEIYTHTTFEQLKEAYAQAHPRG